MLVECLDAEHADADAIVRDLLTRDAAMIRRIQSAIPSARLAADGSIDRGHMRALAFADETIRKKLESLLHPAVRSEWLGMRDAASAKSRHFVVEIPLLYQTGAEAELEAVIAVLASPHVRRERVCAARGLAAGEFDAIAATQPSEGELLRRADHVVWNDFPEEILRRQAVRLADQLISKP